jgi:predicted transcriptional regulator
MADTETLSLAAEIVAAHVSHNSVTAAELPELIRSVHAALAATAKPPEPEAPKQEPAVSIRASVKPDHIVCLEDGAKLKMLKRYLRTRFDMTPDQYRTKWDLPRDYPMVAPAYAEARRGLAQKIGLGRKKASDAVASGADASVTEAAADGVATVDEAVDLTPAPKTRGGTKAAKPAKPKKTAAGKAAPVDTEPTEPKRRSRARKGEATASEPTVS